VLARSSAPQRVITCRLSAHKLSSSIPEFPNRSSSRVFSIRLARMRASSIPERLAPRKEEIKARARARARAERASRDTFTPRHCARDTLGDFRVRFSRYLIHTCRLPPLRPVYLDRPVGPMRARFAEEVDWKAARIAIADSALGIFLRPRETLTCLYLIP